MKNSDRMLATLLVITLSVSLCERASADLSAPSDVVASDVVGDDGQSITVRWKLPSTDAPDAIKSYSVAYSVEKNGMFTPVAPHVASEQEQKEGFASTTVPKLTPGQDYYFAVRAVGDGAKSEWAFTGSAVQPTEEWLDASKYWFGAILMLICGSVIAFVLYARTGGELKVRRIAGLEAIDEAVGRATEMGRSCIFVPGIQDISDIQTVAGVTVLSKVAETAADYDASVEVPTCRSLVMTTCRETMQASYLSAGRPDAYNPDLIYYVTDEQFGYVAYLSGMMVREEPAACFYMGAFFAESLILAETGNSIGAIQVAGTAQPAQLPFFVAACDYTLIGEEFFAASAYLSGDPDQLGSLKGQDIGKILVGVLVLIGCLLATFAQFGDGFNASLDYLTNTILQ